MSSENNSTQDTQKAMEPIDTVKTRSEKAAAPVHKPEAKPAAPIRKPEAKSASSAARPEAKTAETEKKPEGKAASSIRKAEAKTGGPVRKNRFEGRENLLLGKDQEDAVEKAILEEGTIEREIIEKKESGSLGGKKPLFSFANSGNLKEFLITNYKYIILIFLFVALIIVLISLMSGQDTKKEKTDSTKSTLTTQMSDTLEMDLYPEVNDLVTKYLSAWADSDVNMLETMVSPFDAETEKEEIGLNKDYIESMNNIKCYTKPGPVEDSYIVYAYYEMKFKGVDTLAPGLVHLFVFPTEDGSYFIWDYKDYIVSGSDVNTLISDVNSKYDEAIASDEKLKERVDGLAAGEAFPEEETTTEATTEATTAATEATTAATEATTEATTAATEATQAQTTDQVYVLSNVNVRSGAGESSQKIGVLVSGQDYTRVGQEGDWSIIQYNGGTGYVKTEFLHVR